MSGSKIDEKYRALIDALCVEACGWNQKEHEVYLKNSDFVREHGEAVKAKELKKK